jgi:hypothetical protein
VTVPLGNPFTLGATGVLTTARTDRLSLGASFQPGAAALSATSGFLVGPAGTMGELTLMTDALLRVAPFIAVVQGTHNTQQGQYVVPNAVQRDLAVPAKDASQYRRALIIVRVADSLEAGLASSAATDGAWLEIVSGALAATSGAAALPAVPANALVAGELLIPSTGSGQPVSITKYDRRTGSRGGILPVVTTDTTPPAFDGQYRDSPTLGLQRGVGGVWGPPMPRLTDTGWQLLNPGTGYLRAADGMNYRVVDGVCYFQCNIERSATAFTVGTTLTTFPVGARPGKIHWWAGMWYGGGTFEAKGWPDGRLTVGASSSANGLIVAGSFPIG